MLYIMFPQFFFPVPSSRNNYSKRMQTIGLQTQTCTIFYQHSIPAIENWGNKQTQTKTHNHLNTYSNKILEVTKFQTTFFRAYLVTILKTLNRTGHNFDLALAIQTQKFHLKLATDHLLPKHLMWKKLERNFLFFTFVGHCLCVFFWVVIYLCFWHFIKKNKNQKLSWISFLEHTI